MLARRRYQRRYPIQNIAGAQPEFNKWFFNRDNYETGRSTMTGITRGAARWPYKL